MELRQLAAFVAVADEGSFTRASDRLHVVQSAVSANVRNLERELGAALFDRSTHRVQLTEEGRALLPEARATLHAVTAARDAVDAVRGGVRGTVLLGTMQAQGNAVSVAGLLAEFRSEHPAVQVHVRHAAGGSSEMALQVREGRLDLAFVAAPAGELPGVELTALAGEPIRLVVPATHPLAKRATVELSALTDEIHADFPEGWGIRTLNDLAYAEARIARAISYEINDTHGLVDFIRHGLAIGMLPASLIDNQQALTLIPIHNHAAEFVTSIATPSNRRLTAAARALLATINRRVISS
ncbi:MAG: LysR family transcriptional regulator [Solirubrobacteraceae bacterium]|jgi:DNA-binding transcriptional LysR family regulator